MILDVFLRTVFSRFSKCFWIWLTSSSLVATVLESRRVSCQYCLACCFRSVLYTISMLNFISLHLKSSVIWNYVWWRQCIWYYCTGEFITYYYCLNFLRLKIFVDQRENFIQHGYVARSMICGCGQPSDASVRWIVVNNVCVSSESSEVTVGGFHVLLTGPLSRVMPSTVISPASELVQANLDSIARNTCRIFEPQNYYSISGWVR